MRVKAGGALACLALVTVLLGAACGDGGQAGSPTGGTTPEPAGPIVIGTGDPIVIGVSAVLSGGQAGLGRDIADAVDLALSDFGGDLHGHALKMVAVDDGCSDAERAVEAAAELIQTDGMAGVIGPMCTTGAQAANAVYEREGVVHIVPSASRPQLSRQGARFFFRTSWRDDAQARVQAAVARETIGARTAIIVDDGEPYGTSLGDDFTSAFEDKGGAVLARKRIVPGGGGVSTLAGEIAGVNPDLVVYEGVNPQGALLISALREGGYGGAFLGPDALLNLRDFVQATGVSAEGAVLTGGTTPDEAFVARFSAKFGRVPSTPFVLQAHDAATILLQAIDARAEEGEAGTLRIDRLALADTVRATVLDGLTGTVAFDAAGDRAGETEGALGLSVYRVTAGAFQRIR